MVINAEPAFDDRTSLAPVPGGPQRALPPSVVPGTARLVGTAGAAFVGVFLISGFIGWVVRDDGWGSAAACAAALGIVGAGVQLMLIALRGRRELGEFPEA